MNSTKLYFLAHVPIVIACILVMMWISSIYTGVETYRAFLWMLIGWLIYITAVLLAVANTLYEQDK